MGAIVNRGLTLRSGRRLSNATCAPCSNAFNAAKSIRPSSSPSAAAEEAVNGYEMFCRSRTAARSRPQSRIGRSGRAAGHAGALVLCRPALTLEEPRLAISPEPHEPVQIRPRLLGAAVGEDLREQADKVGRRPPNVHLTAEAAQLRPGRALDAGCGHGADTLWLARMLAGHGRGFLRGCLDSRAGDGLGGRRRDRRAHRVAGGRPCDVDGSPRALRSRDLLVCTHERSRDGHGPAHGERGRSGWDLVHGRSPPNRSDEWSRGRRSESNAGLGRKRSRRARNIGVGARPRRSASTPGGG